MRTVEVISVSEKTRHDAILPMLVGIWRNHCVHLPRASKNVSSIFWARTGEMGNRSERQAGSTNSFARAPVPHERRALVLAIHRQEKLFPLLYGDIVGVSLDDQYGGFDLLGVKTAGYCECSEPDPTRVAGP